MKKHAILRSMGILIKMRHKLIYFEIVSTLQQNELDAGRLATIF